MAGDEWDRIHQKLDSSAANAVMLVVRYITDLLGGDEALLAELHARYQRGNEEHGNDWCDWPIERFDEEAREEMLDLVLYCAMKKVRLEDLRAQG